MQRIDDLEGKAELTVREPANREGSYEPSSQGRFIGNLYSGLIIWSGLHQP
jgi:tetrahydromethanopterin S-methyltransferase subunit G